MFLRQQRLLVFTMIVFLGSMFSSEGFGEEVIKAKLNNAYNPRHLSNLTALKFAELAKEKTAGKLEIEVYSGGELYDRKQEMMALSTGAIQMSAQNVIGLFDISREYFVTFLPFLWSDYNSLRMLYETPEWKAVEAKLEKKAKIKILCKNAAGPGIVFNNKRAIKEPADLKGLKMRASSPAEKVAFEKSGALVVTIPVAELFSSMQSGMVDGGATSSDRFIMQGFMEIAKYSSSPVEAPFNLTDGWLIANSAWWESLPIDIRNILEKEVFPAVEKFNSQLIEAADKEFVEKANHEGVTVTTWNKDAMRSVSELGWVALKKEIGEELYNKAMEVAGVK
jgi:C4-dicarboxylate-binding protein DctP